MNPQELHNAIRLLTTDQRKHVEFYQEPIRGDELPLHTRIRVTSGVSAWVGKMGQIVGYHQPGRGWPEWYWVRFDDMPEAIHYSELPKIHREHFEVIE